MVKEFESEKTKLVNIVEMTKKTIQQKDWELEELRNEVRIFEFAVFLYWLKMPHSFQLMMRLSFVQLI